VNALALAPGYNMARLIHGVASSSPIVIHNDLLTDLNRLLNRLHQTILRADAEREARLRASEFEREKAQTNIRYAQSLLTKLEQEATTIKIHTRRQELQAELNRKREALEQIRDHLSDLAEIAATGAGDDADDGGDTSEGDDILAEVIATPSESLNSSRSPQVAPENLGEGDVQGQQEDEMPNMLETPMPPTASQPEQQQQQQSQPPVTEPPRTDLERVLVLDPPPKPATTTIQSLRSRGSNPPSKQDSHTSALSQRSALFGHRDPNTQVQATSEVILDHQRAEQDLLSESILKLASDLKASTNALSASLEEDREVVDRAGQGMNKTGEGMDAVTRRMGTLQRMTEGEGWWGRMRLYAQVYGLMVVLVLLVFVLPKLRL